MFTFTVDYEAISLGPEHVVSQFRPVPASECLPDWFKDIEPQKFKTAKSCRGIYDVMTAGYMVLWPFDATISKDDTGKVFVSRTRDDERHMFNPHPHNQMGPYPDAKLPMQKFGVDKVTLPYKIKSSKGTSLIMMQPPYRPELKIEVMPGIIDTDTFYSPLNVLFMVKNTDFTKDIKIAAGTPLALLMPYVRSEWEIEYNPIDQKLNTITQDNIHNLDGYYKKKLWTRKVFKRKVD
jgi:hypothetical protein